MDLVQPNIVPSQPKKSSLNTMLSVFLVILMIITIGIGAYSLLSINQNKILPKTTPQISPSTPTPSTTVETDNPNNIDVGNVEADLKDIGTDVKGLQ